MFGSGGDGGGWWIFSPHNGSSGSSSMFGVFLGHSCSPISSDVSALGSHGSGRISRA